MPAAGFGCIHSRTTGSVEETFFLRYHDGAVAGGEATFRPCRYDGCVLSRWSASGLAQTIRWSPGGSLACLHNAIFYSASVPVTAQRLCWEKRVHYSGLTGSKDTDRNMEQHQMLCTPRRSRFQWVRTEMESLVKLRVALVQRSSSRMSKGAVHYTVSIANYRCLCRRRCSFL